MNRYPLLLRLIPPLLIVLALALLLHVSTLNEDNLVPGSFDLIVILLGLIILVFSALSLSLREITYRLSERSIRRARESALAEHRRFLRRLDHEIKNPLTAILAGLRGLSITALEEQQQHTVRMIESEVQRLHQLLASLRKLAELETVNLELFTMNVQQFVDDICSLEQDYIKDQGRHFKLVVDNLNELPPLIGDPDLLLTAVHNLLDNALKYTPPGGIIGLCVSRVGDDLMIEVNDTGVGIHPEDQSLVWEELYRGSGTDQIPGNGIGLSLVRSIVERHHGTVDLTSEPAKGTIVRIFLPLV